MGTKMMKVKVAKVRDGLHPSEVVVAVHTLEGTENLVIDKDSLLPGDELDVGYPIRQEDRNYLVELPRETFSGSWRVWVGPDQISMERAVA
jgi:hypothetical protein